MAFRPQSPSKHNMFRGNGTSKGSTTKIPHPPSTKFHDDDGKEGIKDGGDTHGTIYSMFGTPMAKRRKITPTGTPSPLKSSPESLRTEPNAIVPASPAKSLTTSPRTKSARSQEIVQLEDGGEQQEIVTGDVDRKPHTSQLETALPPVQTDAEAIEAYEAHQAAEALEAAENATEQSDKDDTLEKRMVNSTWTRGRSSIYVDAFNLALSTVLEDEGHLFDQAEQQVFQCWKSLSYEAQYLYVRLFLRKTSAWFRIAKLGYYSDIADVAAAVQELQVERVLPKVEEAAAPFPGERTLPDEALPLDEKFVFAESSDDNITSLDEASSLLLLDELKVLAKEARVQGKNKTELLKNLRRTSGRQRGLGFLKRSETEETSASGRSTPGPEDGDDPYDNDAEPDNISEGVMTPTNDIRNRDEHFTKKILEQTGKCVRLALTPLKLFERVHLVFYRSTEWTDKSLTTLILAKISRRNFPEYIVSRSATIFESRSLLLEFEASLRTQFRVDSILELNGTPSRQGLEEVRSTFEAVYPRWKALLVKEQLKEDRMYESGEGAYLRRFSPAWVYTRIVHKALAILAKFKEHLREHELICELLDQRLFHAARRGLWYQRKALLEEHYMYALTDSQGRSEEVNKKHWKRVALATCEEGLRDNECHVIYHYDLQKRIKKLEKQLRTPKREQHEFGHVGLLKARERSVDGTKMEREEEPSPMIRRKDSTASNRSQSRERNANTPTGDTPQPPTKRQSTKTIWLDTLDTNEPVSVESMCLSHYRKVLGWKGYHSEGGILRTLFGLLFYDVLFTSYVPNVFQTAYQTCPLDLHTDAFYSARISEINALINRITNGDAQQIIHQTWRDHYERRTCIVGVRWDEYALDDLLEIARCWTGEALGTVMRVMAQEYASRGGGVPDLFLWKAHQPGDQQQQTKEEHEVPPSSSGFTSSTQATQMKRREQEEDQGNTRGDSSGYGTVMFSEVKSENDRLSDTQRLWISVLLNAGVQVELCHAVAQEIIPR